MLLKNKVIVVTGGAGLLGSEFIKAIVKEGGIGIATDINEDRARKVAEIVNRSGLPGKADYCKTDITSKESIEHTISFALKKYGKIDALVNSAYPRNPNYGRKFEEVTYKDFCENINLHLGGYFLTSQQFALYFEKQGHGNVVNIASIYGVIPPRFEIYEGTNMSMPVEYACIKSAIIHLTKYMAKYFKGKNIRFNCISPGGILDNQPDVFLEKYNAFGLSKGMLHKEDVNGTLIFLLSDMSKHINGQNIVVDDGWTL